MPEGTPSPVASPYEAVMPPARSSSARTAWTVVGLIVAVVLVAGWTGRQVHVQFTSGFVNLPLTTRSFSGSVKVLTIESQSGTVSVQAGTTRTASLVTWGTRGPATPPISASLSGGTLTVNSNCGPTDGEMHCQRNLNVTVPSHTKITVNSSTGNVVIDKMQAGTAVECGNGDIAITGGSTWVNVTSGTGNVNVSGSHTSVTARTQIGDVTVEGSSGSLHLASGTGNVSATHVSASTVLVTAQSGDTALDLSDSPHQVEVQSGPGNVTVLVPPSLYQYQVLTTGSTGPTHVKVATSPSSTRLIRVRSQAGTVTIGYNKTPKSTANNPTTPSPPTTVKPPSAPTPPLSP
jgi:Putative adhesin